MTGPRRRALTDGEQCRFDAYLDRCTHRHDRGRTLFGVDLDCLTGDELDDLMTLFATARLAPLSMTAERNQP